jgi:hypothetical protein
MGTKIVATKLDLQEILTWIDSELHGYAGRPAVDLPPYRRLAGRPRYLNPYNGWQALLFADPEK